MAIIGRDGLFTPTFLRWLEEQNNSVALETAKPGNSEFRSHIFLEPSARIECYSLDEVTGCLKELEYAVKQGLYVAGFMSYELGYAFEEICSTGFSFSGPLMWFGVYEEPLIYNHRSKIFEMGEERALRIVENVKDLQYHPTVREIASSPSINEKEFHRALLQIKKNIRDGNTYQVNFSFKLKFPWEHCRTDLYCQLRNSQRVAYAALIRQGSNTILSFSPELFFRLQKNKMTLRPMKGTASRGRNFDEDKKNRLDLLSSAKDRAENLMIVDLLRNDVGRIAKVGSVKVPKYYEVEKYETVYQATSVIEAKLNPGCSLPEIISSVFPSGSITGAPKIRTMEIIQELEREPRGVYTGCIGFFSPNQESVFNVAIRTVVLDGEKGLAEMGVGSGVTNDSDIAAEHRECFAKARFLGGGLNDFELVETLKWDCSGGWFLLEKHLNRLKCSAVHFGFFLDLKEIRSSLRNYEKELRNSSERIDVFRVRIIVCKTGKFRISHDKVPPADHVERAAIAVQRIDPENRFLYHKTSNREVYNRAVRIADEIGLFDIVFLNEKGEVAEGARSNVIIRKGSQYFTPPINCGLLPGLFREFLLESQDMHLQERVLYSKDVFCADEVFLCNSVRGLQKVEIVNDFSRF